jgi:hypothetical protein
MPTVADKLSSSDDGEAKFLEMVAIWLDITAPRYWWSQFDTYRIGVSKSSQSTMNKLGKRELTQADFQEEIPDDMLSCINRHIRMYQKKETTRQYLKNLLPEGYLQRRVVCLNYKSLRNIVRQRMNHRLPEWKRFCIEVRTQVRHPNFLD